MDAPNTSIETTLEQTVVILANGAFPCSELALKYFRHASKLVCCDGAAQKACSHGRNPDYIVGDCDSISSEIKQQFKQRIIKVTEQETNDLTKAFRFCLSNNWRKIIILGATGEREDHTLGNIARFADFAKEVDDINMITDNGIFYSALCSKTFSCNPGSQVSIFSFDPEQEITSKNLKYPLNRLKLPRWYTATLNEALADSFSLSFSSVSPVLVFIAFE